MEVEEAAEQVRSALEEQNAEHEREASFRRRVAIVIAVLAALLAIAAIFGDNAATDEINANVYAADVRSTHDASVTQLQAYQQTIRGLQEDLANPNLPPEVRSLEQQHLSEDQQAAARLQSNPADQTGIDELEAQIRSTEREQAIAASRTQSYDISVALFQIGIVLASVAILIVSAQIALLASGAGLLAFVMLLNGLLLVVRL